MTLYIHGKHYLGRMERLGITPNFWCSQEYFWRAGIKFSVVGDSYLASAPDGSLFLPILGKQGPLDGVEVFAAFPCMQIGQELDRQYIYTPGKVNLSGNAWKPVRANVHRVQRKLGNLALWPMSPSEDVKRAALMLQAWSQKQGDQVYDPELMVDYLIDGDNRLALRDEHHNLHGILAWDYNYKYTNFRYCVVAQGVDGLSDVARLMFREWCGIHHPDRLINDGGDLDRPGLRRYKEKLQPIEIHTIKGKAT